MERKNITKIGEAILDKTSGMQTIDLARSLEISKTHLNHIINGKRRLSIKVARRLASETDRSAKEWMDIAWAEELG